MPGEEAASRLYIDSSIEENFKESARWAKFIAVSGMVMSAIGIVMSFTLGGRIESALNEGFVASRPGAAGFLWVMVILLAAISFFVVCVQLFRFALKMQAAIKTSDKYEFIVSMKNLRNTYKVIAILFSIYFLLFIGAAITDFFK